MKLLFATVLAFHAVFASGTSSGRANLRRGLTPAEIFPAYNQQCRDDAGPPYVDDIETFGPDKKYFDGKPAIAVGDCPDALKGACSNKDKLAAFLEGPVDCGGKGWFCRILEEPEWPNVNLKTDVNFGYCNTTEGFNDPGYDRAGHCHGSNSDDTFYWWVRDHWYRQYNGRLRCCCGWDDVTEGKIVNRCDFRRLVTPDEDLEQCRDANEEGVTPYNGGCDQNAPPTLNEDIPEDDAKCWEVQNYGEPCDDNCGGGNENPDEDEDDNDNENEDEDNNENENEDNNNNEEDNESENEEDEDENNNDENDEDEDNENDNENEEDEENNNEDEDNDNNNEEDESNENDEDKEDEDEDNENDNNNEEDEDNENDEDGEDEDEDNETDNEEDEDNQNENEDEDKDEDDEEVPSCEDEKSFLFKDRPNKDCSWVAKRAGKLCKKKSFGKKVSESCPKTCGKCSSDNEDNDNEEPDGCSDDSGFAFKGKKRKTCDWIKKKAKKNPKICNKTSEGTKVKDACPVACGACSDKTRE